MKFKINQKSKSLLMIRYLLYTVTCIFLSCICLLQASDYDKELEYADYLYKEKEWFGAYLQYQKVLFTGPPAAVKRTAALALVKSCLKGGDNALARKYINKYKNAEFSDKIFIQEILLLEARLELYSGNYRLSFEGALSVLSNISEIEEEHKGASYKKLQKEALYTGLIGLLDSRSFDEFLRDGKYYLNTQAGRKSSFLTGPLSLLEPVNSRVKLKKSPFIGGALSLIPGLGQAYAGRYPEALLAFLLNAGLISASVFLIIEDFKLPEIDRKGWLTIPVTGIAGLFYAANIWGSVNLVLDFNRGVETEMKNEVRTGINKIALKWQLDI